MGMENRNVHLQSNKNKHNNKSNKINVKKKKK